MQRLQKTGGATPHARHSASGSLAVSCRLWVVSLRTDRSERQATRVTGNI